MAQPTVRSVHIDAPMSRISVAYRNPSYLAEQIFPIVPVNNQSDKYFVFDKASWFRNEAAVRAPGTRGPEVDYSVSSSAYACVEISATKTVPDEMVRNADTPLAPRREASEFVTDKVLLYLEYDAATNYINADSAWTASGANGTSTGSLYWSNDLSDPIEHVNKAKDEIIKAIGREPNVMVMGRDVYRAIINHPDMLDKVKHTGVGLVDLPVLHKLFQMPKVLVGNSVYNSALEGVTASYSFIWGKYVWLGWVPPSPGLMVPAAGYIFTWQNRTIERFRREEEKTDAIRCGMSYDVVLTSPDAGFLLKTAVA